MRDSLHYEVRLRIWSALDEQTFAGAHRDRKLSELHGGHSASLGYDGMAGGMAGGLADGLAVIWYRRIPDNFDIYPMM